GQRREEGEVLERPPDAELRDPMGRQPEDRTAVEADITLVGRGEAAQAVEERRLAGAVRADEADDLPRVHVEGDGVEREDAAEADGEVTNGQDWHREIRSVYGTRTRKTKKPRPPCLPELEEVAVPHREIEVLDPDPAATAGRQVVHARAVEHDGLSRQPRERSMDAIEIRIEAVDRNQTEPAVFERRPRDRGLRLPDGSMTVESPAEVRQPGQDPHLNLADAGLRQRRCSPIHGERVLVGKREESEILLLTEYAYAVDEPPEDPPVPMLRG